MANVTPTSNHSRAPVPTHELVSGWAIATVIVGVGITLPAFVIGAAVIRALGLRDGVVAFAVGGASTALLALLTMRVGAKTRASTYSIVRRCFGVWGSQALNVLLALTLLGWYGVTATLFGDALGNSIRSVFAVSVSPLVLTALGGVLMIVTTIFGFRAIDRLSRIAVPALLTVLLFSVWRVFDDANWSTLLAVPSTPTTNLSSIPAAVSVLVGSFIVGVTLTPDLARFSRSPSEAVPAAIASYGIGYPIILLLAGLPVLLHTDNDLISAMEANGLGLAALLVMVVATWTTNVNNLYSASLGVARVVPAFPDWLITVACGVTGTGMALAGIMNVFIPFLIFLGVFIPPIAGIYLTAHHRHDIDMDAVHPVPSIVWPAVIAWLVASAWGLVVYFQPSLIISGIPAIDTLVVAVVAYAVLARLLPARIPH
ncbi:MAG: cytosine permease [Pseudomonadota bacterium]